MAGIAEQNYHSTMGVFKKVLEVLEKWFKDFAEYLEKNAEWAPYKKLAKQMSKSGGQVYNIQFPSEYDKHYSCEEFKRELAKHGIPFFATSEENKIIIGADQFDKIKELNRTLLVAKCNYFQEVDTVEMEDAIAKIEGIKDKEMLTFHGLSDYECEVFKNKCNAITKGFMVGIVPNPDNPERYDVTVHAADVLKSKPGAYSIDVCRAYVESMFSLYGLNSLTKVNQIDADREINREIKALMDTGEVFYVVDAKNPGVFMEINANGLEFYTTVMDDDGKRHDNQVAHIAKNDPNYEYEMRKYLDSMKNKAILSSSEELSKHLMTKAVNIDYLRPDKTPEEEKISMAEDKITLGIDTMIKEKFAERNFDSCIDKFNAYQSEVKEIMNALIEDREPEGYPGGHDIFSEIRDTIKTSGMNIGVYANALKRSESIQIESHKAKEKSKTIVQERRDDYGISNR